MLIQPEITHRAGSGQDVAHLDAVMHIRRPGAGRNIRLPFGRGFAFDRNAKAIRPGGIARNTVMPQGIGTADPQAENQMLPWRIDRSEEHTSELQSLMRISYAVFCLKKKKIKRINHKT